MEDVYTVSDLSRKLGLSTAVIKTVTKELSPDLTVGDGYYKFYSLEKVTDALIERNRPLLVALGFVEATGQFESEVSE